MINNKICPELTNDLPMETNGNVMFDLKGDGFFSQRNTKRSLIDRFQKAAAKFVINVGKRTGFDFGQVFVGNVFAICVSPC